MKNNYYYSFTEKGFYWLSEDELNDSAVPTDLVPISEDVHAALMFGQEKDLCRYVALVMLYADEKNLSQTKTALHRTRLRFLDR